ncbi:MAG TPA: hypothetical protein VL171_18885 [Verrucomicrobiae bacterium]|nr:hypothetical protein [Verrucomicrobiae bacterium]
MKQMIKALCFGSVASLISFLTLAHADVIDFDSQGLFGPSTFAQAGSAQTVSVTTTVGVVTFQGGVLITAGTSNPNTSSIYATAFISDLTNVLTITFPVPVTNFSIMVGNGELASPYLVADNAGHTQSTVISFLGTWQPTFPVIGTTVQVEAILPNPPNWNFWIDNISFDAIPEPTGVALVAGAFVTLLLLRGRERP